MRDELIEVVEGFFNDHLVEECVDAIMDKLREGMVEEKEGARQGSENDGFNRAIADQKKAWGL